MTEPGWYYAQGDAPGVERYWDGLAWMAETRQGAVPAHPAPAPQSFPSSGALPFHAPPVAPVPVSQVDKRGFSDLLRVTAIVLSVLKAIPWLLLTFAVLVIADLAREIESDGSPVWRDFGNVFGELLSAAVVVLVLIAVAGLLLLLQFIGAIKRNQLMVFVPALVLAIIDILFTIGCIATVRSVADIGDATGSCYFIIAVAAAQILVVVLSLKAQLQRADSGG